MIDFRCTILYHLYIDYQSERRLGEIEKGMGRYMAKEEGCLFQTGLQIPTGLKRTTASWPLGNSLEQRV